VDPVFLFIPLRCVAKPATFAVYFLPLRALWSSMDAGSLSAIGREIGRAIIQAIFFRFDVAQHHPRCQSKQGYSGHDDLLEDFFVHGCLICSRKGTPKTVLTGIQLDDMNQLTPSGNFEG
jgi:hypothetical protein